jgi:hypothetical protein
VTGRQGRRRRKLLDDLKERWGYSHLKEEALDRTMWRAHFGRGFGPVVRQTAKWINDLSNNRVFRNPSNHLPGCTVSQKFKSWPPCKLYIQLAFLLLQKTLQL